MKPAQIRAEKKRKERVRLRAMARQIKDNSDLSDLLIFQFPEKPIRAEVYRRIVPYLRFKPVSLEEINGVS